MYFCYYYFFRIYFCFPWNLPDSTGYVWESLDLILSFSPVFIRVLNKKQDKDNGEYNYVILFVRILLRSIFLSHKV